MKIKFRWARSKRQPSFSSVAIETSTHCNRRCGYCPVSADPKGKDFMKVETFELILKQLKELNYRGRITYHHYNEPLLNKNLETLVAYSKRILPRVKNIIYTNGDLLTPKRFHSLLKAGVDRFIVTDHGFKKIPELLQNRAWWSFRKQRKIRLRRFNSASSLFNRGGLVEIDNMRTHSYCAYPTYEMVIDVSGNVILCCNDYYGHYTFGNVTERHIREIWASELFSAVRNDLLAGQFTLDICKKCVNIS